MHSRIAGTGGYLPAQHRHQRRARARASTRATNGCARGPGSAQRHIAADDEQTSDLALAASLKALGGCANRARRRRPDRRRDDDARHDISVDGVHPAGEARHHGGAAFDVQAVCSGFVYALAAGRPHGQERRGAQCPGRGRGDLFAHPRLERPWDLRALRRRRGRGRSRSRRCARGFCRRICTRTDTTAISSPCLARVANGAVRGTPFLQNGWRRGFKFAVKVLAEVAQEALAANKLPPDAIDWLIPHQANIRIMEATMKKLGLPLERMVIDGRAARQYLGGVDPAGARLAVRDGRIRRRTARHAGRGRRRLHVGLGAATLVKIKSGPIRDETGDGFSRAGLAVGGDDGGLRGTSCRPRAHLPKQARSSGRTCGRWSPTVLPKSSTRPSTRNR